MNFQDFLARATPGLWTLRFRLEVPSLPSSRRPKIMVPFPADRDLDTALNDSGKASTGTYAVAVLAKGSPDQRRYEREILGLEDGEKILGTTHGYVRPDGEDHPPEGPPPELAPASRPPNGLGTWGANGGNVSGKPPLGPPLAGFASSGTSKPAWLDEIERDRARVAHEIDMLKLEAEKRRLLEQLGAAAAVPPGFSAPPGRNLEWIVTELLQELRTGRSTPSSPAAPVASQWVPLIGALAPLVSPFIAGLLDNRSRLLDELLAMFRARVKDDPSATLSGMLDTFTRFREVATELVPDSGKESSPIGQLIDVLRPVLEAKLREQASAPSSSSSPDAQQQAAPPSPEQIAQHRVAVFVGRLVAEIQADADASAVAEVLAPLFDLLPGRARKALLEGDPSSWEATVGPSASALARVWVQMPGGREWLTEWRDAMMPDEAEPVSNGAAATPDAGGVHPPVGETTTGMRPVAPWDDLLSS